MSLANPSRVILLSRTTTPVAFTAYAGNPLELTLLFAAGGSSNVFNGIDTLRLEIHPDNLINSGRTPLALLTWASPTGTALTGTLTSAQLNLLGSSTDQQKFWVVVYAITGANVEVFQVATLTLQSHPAALLAALPPAVGDAVALTKAQADALYAALGYSPATLATARTIGITGDIAYTSPPFNGGANVTAAATLATVNSTPGSFGGTTAIPVITIDGKGRITAATTAAVAIPGPTVQTLGDSNTTIATGTTVARITAISTARTYTLPNPVNYPAGSTLTVLDATGNLSSTTVATLDAGAFTINGVGTMALSTPYASPILVSNGINGWTLDIRGVSRGGTGATDAAAARTNLGLGTGDSPTFLSQSLAGQNLAGTQATSLVNLAAIWNTTGTPTAIKLNVTDTASNAASNLMDLQVGGVSKFTVGKTGAINANANFIINGTILQSAGNIIPAASLILDYFNQDVKLTRDANGILAQRNGTNPQSFRVYNSCDATPATNYDRAFFGFTSNELRIGTEIAGTYTTPRNVNLMRNGAVQLILASGGLAANTNLIFNTHNAYDIGATGGVSCPKNIYVGTEIITPKITVSAGNLSNLGITFGTQSRLVSNGDGLLLFGNSGITNFDKLQLGGSTSAFPAIKRNGTGIDIRLADDSAFAPVKGKLTTDTAYTATVVATTGYITIYDSTGTAYRVPCAV